MSKKQYTSDELSRLLPKERSEPPVVHQGVTTEETPKTVILRVSRNLEKELDKIFKENNRLQCN
jgi:hypothetical protein